MHGTRGSLRWRIAISYAALLIGVLALAGGILIWRFQTILLQEAHARVEATMREITAAAAPQSNPFGFVDASGTFAMLLGSNSLSTWESPSSFVQVDSAGGYPLAKTSNLGASIVPPNHSLTLADPAATRTVSIAGRPFLVLDHLLHSGRSSVIVHVAEPLDELNRTFAQARQAFAIVFALAIAAIVVLSFMLASQAIEPINRLSRAMREIGSDRLDRRLAWRRRNDEIGALAESFDDLLARLEEAFARERQFISDASHELKTPLTSINANAQMLLRWGDSDATVREESLRTIVSESATLAGIVNGMLTLAKADRGDELPREPVSLAHVAGEAVRNAAHRAHEKALALTFDACKPSPIVLGDEHLLRQLASNLIDNAIKFTQSGGVTVRVGCDAAHGWIEVEDTGTGIPENELPHVFERFYRADRARSRDVPGTGLGLAIVRSIARVHGANVVAERASGGGTLVRATFALLAQPLTSPS